MIQGKSVLVIIPARGGSKRLPRKNCLLLRGKPLIAYSIEAGRQSKYVDEVLVSTDDDEIAVIGHAYGASVPFMRPPSLATDEATTVDVICHAIQYYKVERQKVFDYIMVLQPTSPLRTVAHVDAALELLIAKQADAVVSVCETAHSPLWANVLPDDGSLQYFLRPEVKGKRSQDLPVHYRLNGAIYICDIKRFLQEKDLFLADNIFAYQMTQECSVDIDNKLDFQLCEILLKSSDS